MTNTFTGTHAARCLTCAGNAWVSKCRHPPPALCAVCWRAHTNLLAKLLSAALEGNVPAVWHGRLSCRAEVRTLPIVGIAYFDRTACASWQREKGRGGGFRVRVMGGGGGGAAPEGDRKDGATVSPRERSSTRQPGCSVSMSANLSRREAWSSDIPAIFPEYSSSPAHPPPHPFRLLRHPVRLGPSSRAAGRGSIQWGGAWDGGLKQTALPILQTPRTANALYCKRLRTGFYMQIYKHLHPVVLPLHVRWQEGRCEAVGRYPAGRWRGPWPQPAPKKQPLRVPTALLPTAAAAACTRGTQ